MPHFEHSWVDHTPFLGDPSQGGHFGFYSSLCPLGCRCLTLPRMHGNVKKEALLDWGRWCGSAPPNMYLLVRNSNSTHPAKTMKELHITYSCGHNKLYPPPCMCTNTFSKCEEEGRNGKKKCGPGTSKPK